MSDLIATFGDEKALELLDKLEADTQTREPKNLPAPFPATVIPDEGERGRGRPPKIPLSPQALRDELEKSELKSV